MSDSVRPHRQQPTRLPRPWDSPGKNTGLGCHFLLQCVKVKLLSRVRLFATPWTTAYQAPPPMGFPRQEYWSGVPLLSPKLAGGTFSNMVPLVSISQGRNYIDCANTGEGQLGHMLFGISVVSAQTSLRRPARTTDGAGLGLSYILASQLAWQFPVHLFLVSAQEVSRAT